MNAVDDAHDWWLATDPQQASPDVTEFLTVLLGPPLSGPLLWQRSHMWFQSFPDGLWGVSTQGGGTACRSVATTIAFLTLVGWPVSRQQILQAWRTVAKAPVSA